MIFSKVRRQLLLGVMSVALAAGLSTQTYAADNLLEQVKHHGTLVVGLEGTYPPFSFQGEDGKLTGFEVDFANALAEHLGVKAKLNPTKWDGMLASLDSKRIDVVINQVTISDERKKKYDFSTPYTVSGIQALVKKGNEGTITKPEDLKGKKVGVTATAPTCLGWHGWSVTSRSSAQSPGSSHATVAPLTKDRPSMLPRSPRSVTGRCCGDGPGSSDATMTGSTSMVGLASSQLLVNSICVTGDSSATQ